MERRLKQMGLRVSDKETPGDGSCLFHALLDQIQSHPSLPPYADSHYELRYKIVSEGYDLFKETNKPPWHTETSMMEWRMKMLNPKEWGDETVLVLASELLHVDIQIIPAFGEVTIIKSSNEASNKQLFSLFHFSEVDFYSAHYQSVQPSLPVSHSPSLPASFTLDEIEVSIGMTAM